MQRDLHKTKDALLHWDVHLFDEVDSTNMLAKEAIAKGMPEATCFIARRQVAAYGRQGRSWSSPEGGLYFSFILDPIGAHHESAKSIEDLPSVSLLLSLGVQTALEAFTGNTTIRIKWPNDIVVVASSGQAKLCGISLEMVRGKLCCGVGVNVFHPLDAHSSQHERYALAHLVDLMAQGTISPDREKTISRLLSLVFTSIDKAYARWLDEGIEPFIVRYNELLFNKGQQVTLETIQGNTLITGEVLGVAKTGELRLKNDQGKEVRAASGEVHTRRSLGKVSPAAP